MCPPLSDLYGVNVATSHVTRWWICTLICSPGLSVKHLSYLIHSFYTCMSKLSTHPHKCTYGDPFCPWLIYRSSLDTPLCQSHTIMSHLWSLSQVKSMVKPRSALPQLLPGPLPLQSFGMATSSCQACLEHHLKQSKCLMYSCCTRAFVCLTLQWWHYLLWLKTLPWVNVSFTRFFSRRKGMTACSSVTLLSQSGDTF